MTTPLPTLIIVDSTDGPAADTPQTATPLPGSTVTISDETTTIFTSAAINVKRTCGRCATSSSTSSDSQATPLPTTNIVTASDPIVVNQVSFSCNNEELQSFVASGEATMSKETAEQRAETPFTSFNVTLNFTASQDATGVASFSPVVCATHATENAIFSVGEKASPGMGLFTVSIHALQYSSLILL